MKTLILLLPILFLGNTFQTVPEKKLSTKVYDWNALKIEKTNSGERRQILEGKTNALDYLEIHVTTLDPGNAPHASHVHTDIEELIIVKEGKIEQNIKGVKKILGPGSVILALPGDDHGIQNAGDTQASYYIIRWKANSQVDKNGTKQNGGSAFYDWEKIAFQTTSKGGKRQIMDRETSLLSNLEMHVTTLNEGVTSHAEHVHSNEEIILIIKGEAEESIAGTPHRMGPGSLVLLTDEVPHGIRNAGKGQCEYFAFKWVK
ncbi:cupin domain-containing protein [Maribellus maritimus]|uniref:cupin domain-containing protein n=1 Tax=Maribellus maritimus TaxID=2870838 RepID=UPI001EEB7A61|nr:cupin domain-containing protein [Maribellus maritimus]MCG6188223.1 cupin domain-containing protein [Maribellus maritimus]